MTEVLQANIFFFITSIAVLVFTIMVCVVLWYVIKIVQSVHRIVERVEAGSEVLAEDIDNLRSSLNPAKLIQFVLNIIPGMQPKRRRRRGDDE